MIENLFFFYRSTTPRSAPASGSKESFANTPTAVVSNKTRTNQKNLLIFTFLPSLMMTAPMKVSGSFR